MGPVHEYPIATILALGSHILFGTRVSDANIHAMRRVRIAVNYKKVHFNFIIYRNFSYTVIWISVRESSICATKCEPFGDAMISILSSDQCL